MQSIYDSMVKFFQEDNWPFRQIEGKPGLRMDFSGKNGSLACLAGANEETKEFVFYAYYGTNVPENKRRDAADFFTRANYGLTIGNFEMDMRDGEVRYKTSINVADVPLTFLVIKPLVYLNIMTADRYLPGLMTLLFGSASPEQAITLVEGTGEPTQTTRR